MDIKRIEYLDEKQYIYKIYRILCFITIKGLYKIPWSRTIFICYNSKDSIFYNRNSCSCFTWISKQSIIIFLFKALFFHALSDFYDTTYGLNIENLKELLDFIMRWISEEKKTEKQAKNINYHRSLHK